MDCTGQLGVEMQPIVKKGVYQMKTIPGITNGLYEPARRRLLLWGLYGASAAVMFVLKLHYSTAPADHLRWVIQPVAAIVSMVDGVAFEWVSGTGFVRADQRFTIAPACAGLNFLIMVFGLTVAAFLHKIKKSYWRIAWPAAALLSAYLLTLVVNAVRIVIAIRLYESEAAWGWLTPDRLHRLAGIAVYFSALGLYYAKVHSIMDSGAWQVTRRSTKRHTDWLPWVWYVTGAVVVPVAHQFAKGRTLPGWEHCLTVTAASALIWILARGTYRVVKTRRQDASQNPDY